jgi:lipid-binding SYLF domain-containing protein
VLTTTGCASRRSTTGPDAAAPAATSNGSTKADGTAQASEEHLQRLNDATIVFNAMMSAGGEMDVPNDLVSRAECIAVIPAVKKGAFIFGGQYGKGYFSCRQQGGSGWTAPATVRVEGGSIGLQIGGQETDVVLLVMSERGKQRLLSNQFTLGGDASVAAGPVGRGGQVNMSQADILAYQRVRGGAFAGVSIEGATLRQDLDDNQALYGRPVTSADVVAGSVQSMPPAAQQFVQALSTHAARGR